MQQTTLEKMKQLRSLRHMIFISFRRASRTPCELSAKTQKKNRSLHSMHIALDFVKVFFESSVFSAPTPTITSNKKLLWLLNCIHLYFFRFPSIFLPRFTWKWNFSFRFVVEIALQFDWRLCSMNGYNFPWCRYLEIASLFLDEL